MSPIGCGKMSWDLLYFPSLIIVSGIKFFLFQKINPNTKLHGMTLTFFSLFSETFGGLGAILYFFQSLYKKRQAKKEKKEVRGFKKKVNFKLVQSQALKGQWIVYLIMFALSIINVVVVSILSYIVCQYSQSLIDGKISNSILDYKILNVQVIFISLFSYLILNQSLYKHQWTSLALIVIGICLIIIPNITAEKDIHIRMPLVIATYLLVSIKSVLEKYIMEVKYITSHQFTLFDGFVGSILCILFTYISQLILSKEWSEVIGNTTIVFQEFRETFSNLPLECIMAIASKSCHALLVKLTRFHFTPMHCCICESFSMFLLWLLFIIQNPMSTLNIVISVLGFVMLTIGNLIYNEIIILYFCNLHYNTIQEISERSDNELTKNVLTGIDQEDLMSGNTINYYAE